MYIIKFICPNCKQDMNRHNSALTIKDNEVLPECLTCGMIAEKFLFDDRS